MDADVTASRELLFHCLAASTTALTSISRTWVHTHSHLDMQGMHTDRTKHTQRCAHSHTNTQSQTRRAVPTHMPNDSCRGIHRRAATDTHTNMHMHSHARAQPCTYTCVCTTHTDGQAHTDISIHVHAPRDKNRPTLMHTSTRRCTHRRTRTEPQTTMHLCRHRTPSFTAPAHSYKHGQHVGACAGDTCVPQAHKEKQVPGRCRQRRARRRAP